MTHPFILTCVSSDKNKPLTEQHLRNAVAILNKNDIKSGDNVSFLSPDKATEISLSHDIDINVAHALRTIFESDEIDFFVTSKNNRRKKLLLADMDSTIATSETLDELAAFAGIKDKVADITARAMNGELDFHSALHERVGLLANLPEKSLHDTLLETKLSAGAKTFIQTMRHIGSQCVLVSGGFTFFTNAIADQCGFHNNHGNVLEMSGGKLTGKVIPPILDKHAKVDFLKHYMSEHNITPQECLTIGDGANDLPMLRMAGLGIGYHPKNAVKEEIKNCILYGDLTAALYAQGINDKDFVNSSSLG